MSMAQEKAKWEAYDRAEETKRQEEFARQVRPVPIDAKGRLLVQKQSPLSITQAGKMVVGQQKP